MIRFCHAFHADNIQLLNTTVYLGTPGITSGENIMILHLMTQGTSVKFSLLQLKCTFKQAGTVRRHQNNGASADYWSSDSGEIINAGTPALNKGGRIHGFA